MPLIDMPLDELKKYKGRYPRPADFDQYWDKSLAEMRAIDPNIELIKSEFRCRSQNVSTFGSPASKAREFMQSI